MKRPNRNASAKSLQIFSVMMLLSAVVWAGSEPWKGKPYQQWDDKDIERVFLDSPWSRTTTITRTWLPISSKDLPDKIISGSGRPALTELERSGETSVGGELNFHVLWASSRVMRAASARKAVLHGDKKDVDVEKYAAEPQDEIQILVRSEDMAPFTRKDEKFFQANAFLQPRKSKQKISPSHVRYERDAKGILVISALFFFPRKTASGELTIANDEKNVEFNCNMDGSSLRVNFEPQKMVHQNGLDL
jgi:hypothetical protein